MPPETEDTFTVTMVFQGLARSAPAKGKKGEILGEWIELGDDPGKWVEEAKGVKASIYYGTKNMPSGRPGAIYEFQRRVEKSVIATSAKFVRILDDRDLVMKWQIDYDAFRAVENAKRQEKAAVMADLPWAALKPFRDAYHRMNGFQRSALLVRVINDIQKL